MCVDETFFTKRHRVAGGHFDRVRAPHRTIVMAGVELNHITHQERTTPGVASELSGRESWTCAAGHGDHFQFLFGMPSGSGLLHAGAQGGGTWKDKRNLSGHKGRHLVSRQCIWFVTLVCVFACDSSGLVGLAHVYFCESTAGVQGSGNEYLLCL